MIIPYTIKDRSLCFQGSLRIEVKSVMRVPRGYLGIGKEYNDGASELDVISLFYHPACIIFYGDKKEYRDSVQIPSKWPKEIKKLAISVAKGKRDIREFVKNPEVTGYIDQLFQKMSETPL